MSSGHLPIKSVEKVWGMDDLPAPFHQDGQSARIGEIWFEPPPSMAGLLVKYLFTSEKLSVQVHPPAGASPTGRGKEECWLILDAEPGAKLAMGFVREVSEDEMRAAALDGTIEELLHWREVSAGDFFYIPAGTVHAIGAGLTLLEVQENTDITYRLYDYGRPRELHLAEGLKVAKGLPYSDELARTVPADRELMLVDGPRFTLAQVIGQPSQYIASRFTGTVQVMPLSGSVAIGDSRVEPGQSALADTLDDVAFDDSARVMIARAA
ncbi:class I mannose-6-phosphate isomerase [Qipengyuania sp. GH38]|uniref:class I mannose-6-phosphate isomerase n=1 Tax=Qipengyuania intermedia TaxID=2867244 RepID=UPI001C86A0B1|nr:class I mannose-6-phosphate isomerase [Qipengyuania intermedia]MBX7514372.1 class I mannose-6-phosphate isomerase [Qipengyuania intermedia]